MRKSFLIRWLRCLPARALRTATRMAVLAATIAFAAGAPAQAPPSRQLPQTPARPAPPRLEAVPLPAGAARRLRSEERTGSLATREGLRLRLIADQANVRILTRESAAQGGPQVGYRVRVETDARTPDAQNLLKQYTLTVRNGLAGVLIIGRAPGAKVLGRTSATSGAQAPRFWVSFEVSVPRNYSLDVHTRAGNIETQDIDGRVSLVTGGGNIIARRVGKAAATIAGANSQSHAGLGGRTGVLMAKLETSGGHISVGSVLGDLRAVTAGGHISAADVQGDAYLRSGGGHIRTGAISGLAHLDTSGGNISVQSVGANVTATTGGGQIDFGEATGSIQARTGGGGIRVLRVTGPTQLETTGGSIFLTDVQGPVRASTASGSITAWFWPEDFREPPRRPKPQKSFAASQLESGQGDIVVYLPRGLAVTIDATIEKGAEHSIEADSSLPLKVKYLGSSADRRSVRGEGTMNGGGEVLRLKTVSGNIRLKSSDTDPQGRLNRQQMEQQKRHLELQLRQIERQFAAQSAQMAERLAEQGQKPAAPQNALGPFEEWKRKLEGMWSGEIGVDADTQQRKLIQSVRPAYPEVARQAGIEGTVQLRVSIAKDGSIENVRILSGEPVLAQAAVEAVRQWRYEPTWVKGKPVGVATVVTVEFRAK